MYLSFNPASSSLYPDSVHGQNPARQLLSSASLIGVASRIPPATTPSIPNIDKTIPAARIPVTENTIPIINSTNPTENTVGPTIARRFMVDICLFISEYCSGVRLCCCA